MVGWVPAAHRACNRGRLGFTLSIEDVFADARIAFVCVGTPALYSGDADLAAVWHVLDELPEFEERAVLVMKSTVPVGTGEKVRHELDSRGLAHVGYVANPEFLAEGTAVRDFTHPDRVYWPDVGVTKQDLADYYKSVWGLMAPHVVDVPLSLVRCPDADMSARMEARVDQAIRNGINFLRTAEEPEYPKVGAHVSDELLLLTFLHAGVPKTDARFQELLKRMLESPLQHTYRVALQAMVLEELDRVRYQKRIFHCAQFLVDNQCQNGQWSYGSPTEFIKDVKVPEPAKSVATAAKPREMTKEGKPKVVQHVAVKKMKEGPESGDNSNTQYALLGLYAAKQAGAKIDDAVWKEIQAFYNRVRRHSSPGFVSPVEFERALAGRPTAKLHANAEGRAYTSLVLRARRSRAPEPIPSAPGRRSRTGSQRRSHAAGSRARRDVIGQRHDGLLAASAWTTAVRGRPNRNRMSAA